MAAFYAIYYGPDGLKKKALHAHNNTLILAEGIFILFSYFRFLNWKLIFLFESNLGLKRGNHLVLNNQFFDTIKVKPNTNINSIKSKALSKKINLRYFDDNQHVSLCF